VRAPATTAAKLMPAAAALVLLSLCGTLAFHLVFGSPWGLGLYQTLVTITTLGDARLVPSTRGQYAVVAAATVVGYAVWALTIATVAGTLVSIDVRDLWGGRRMEGRIAALRGHVVVVGGGRVGLQAATELGRAGRSVVILDRDAERVRRLEAAGFLCLARDAAEEGALAAAGLRHAAGVVLALPDDAQNLYVLFAIRDIAPAMPIVARAESERAERHLRALGVERVVMPTLLGGKRLARLLTLPLAADFLDTLVEEAGLVVQERRVAEGDPLAGRAVRELRSVLGQRVTLLALRRDGRLHLLPAADLRLLPGDALLLVAAAAG
jgi:voltage-gated potassium channel